MTTDPKYIVTHLSPDFDAISSSYLLKKAYPNAKVIFVHNGASSNKKNSIHTDTGGKDYDHHHLYGMLSSTFLVYNDKKIIERLPSFIKKNPLLGKFVNSVNLWDNAAFRMLDKDGKDIISKKGRGHVFKLMWGCCLMHHGSNRRESSSRLRYCFDLLDRMFMSSNDELIVKEGNGYDENAASAYDDFYRKNLSIIKSGKPFIAGKRKGIYFKNLPIGYNPLFILFHFDAFIFKKNYKSISGAAVRLSLTLENAYQSLKEEIVKKGLLGNYPGKKGADGEVILVGGDRIILFDPNSQSRLKNFGDRRRRISVNNKKFMKNMVNTKLFFEMIKKSLS